MVTAAISPVSKVPRNCVASSIKNEMATMTRPVTAPEITYGFACFTLTSLAFALGLAVVN